MIQIGKRREDDRTRRNAFLVREGSPYWLAASPEPHGIVVTLFAHRVGAESTRTGGPSGSLNDPWRSRGP